MGFNYRTSPKSNPAGFFLTIFLGIAGSILVGFLLYGGRIFDSHLPHFQFVAFGIIGAVFYATLKYISLRAALVALLMLYIMQVITAGSTTFDWLLRDFVYVGGIGFAVHNFAAFTERELRGWRFGKFLALGLIMAIAYAAITSILCILTRTCIGAALFPSLIKGFLIGGGLGLGLEIAEILSPSSPGKSSTVNQ